MSITTLVLTSDGLSSNEVAYVLLFINRVTIMISACDKVIRVIGFGYRDFFRDSFNNFDHAIVVLSILELYIISAESSAISAFRSARIFRIFRVMRF